MNTTGLLKNLNGNIKGIVNYAYRNASRHALENYFVKILFIYF